MNVLYGTAGGLSAADDQVWHRGKPGVNGTPRADDYFGCSVATGDFDGNGRDDLVVGARDDDVDGVVDAGSAQVLYGTASGLDAAGDQVWHRDRPGVLGAARAYASFGWSVGTGDFDGDGRSDVVVGAPWDRVGGVANAGAVNVLHGSPTGVTASGDQLWYRPVTGAPPSPAAGDWFGFAVGG